jgi:UDP-N-acetyl-D-glucosamine/UDP-N-acetyl-D-galactosamine dehydrogenase
MLSRLQNRDKKLAVIGLGYVGLPLALEFAKFFDVIGYDINEARVTMMQNGQDPSRELSPEVFINKSIIFTSSWEDLRQAHFYIVAVPTPIDQHKTPLLTPLFSASELIGKVIKKGDYVIFESTVYPGCTEEDCIPRIEQGSGLQASTDFHYGYSPERINPGDREHTVANIVKVVSGDTSSSAQVIESVYAQVITAGIFRAQNVKVAEAAKVIENTQRDLNIAFMNELSMIFDMMNIDTHEVLKAAGSKWNFLPFYPGLVGGHCIGVDPYYLTYKSKQLGYLPEVILSGRRINDGIPAFLAKRLIQMLLQNDVHLKGAHVLVLGITFKENVSDIRNSKVAELVKELESYTLQVDVVDPLADAHEVAEEYKINLQKKVKAPYAAVILAVSHDEYKMLTSEDLTHLLPQPNGILMDIKSLFNQVPEHIIHWRM